MKYINKEYYLDRTQKITNLLKKGYHFSEIAKKFKISRQRIHQIAVKNNIFSTKYPKWFRNIFKTENNFLHEYSNSNFSLAQLSKKYSLPYSRVKSFTKNKKGYMERLDILRYYGKRRVRICALPSCQKQFLIKDSEINRHGEVKGKSCCSRSCRSRWNYKNVPNCGKYFKDKQQSNRSIAKAKESPSKEFFYE